MLALLLVLKCGYKMHTIVYYFGIFVFFQAALFTAPFKSDFLKALSKGREVKEEECLEKIKKFLINFSATVDVIYEVYNKMNAELDYTVWLQGCLTLLVMYFVYKINDIPSPSGHLWGYCASCWECIRNTLSVGIKCLCTFLFSYMPLPAFSSHLHSSLLLPSHC